MINITQFSLRRRQLNPLVCVLVHDILFQIPLSRKDIYIVASDWSKPQFDQTQGRNKPIRSDYISCDSAAFETRYLALIRRRLKPLFDTKKPAAEQAKHGFGQFQQRKTKIRQKQV